MAGSLTHFIEKKGFLHLRFRYFEKTGSDFWFSSFLNHIFSISLCFHKNTTLFIHSLQGFGADSYQQANASIYRHSLASMVTYNDESHQKEGNYHPLRRSIPKLQWAGTGLTVHYMSFHARPGTGSWPSHCGIRSACGKLGYNQSKGYM